LPCSIAKRRSPRSSPFESGNYEVTIGNPSTWTKPWTAVVPLKQTTDKLFRYVCHEGNESVEGAPAGARERAAQESAKKGSN
jgi:hypothetical protein